MRENNRNSIEIEKMLPQFTTMNVIDGQAGLMSYSSLIFYSLTIDNIPNIIVLLILAGVTIATLTGDNGILTKAQEASENTKRANAEEQVKLAVQASYGTDGKINMDTLNNELKKIDNLTYKGSPISDSNKITSLPDTVNVDGYNVTINGNGSTSVGDSGGNDNEGESEVDGVTIPDGFYYVGGSKEEGIVISDSAEDENKGTSWEVAKTLKGNQFVWVPVEDDSAFKTYKGYYDGNIDSMLSDCKEPYEDGYVNEVDEYNAMKKSVLEHDGFYVGRYEAGTANAEERAEESGITDDVVVKQGANVYNYIGWSDSDDIKDETGGAVQKAKEFASENNYTSVISTLIYGVQWDAIMAWIEPRYKSQNIEIKKDLLEEKNFVADSTGKGNYDEDENTNPWRGSVTTTGASADYVVKNIYDLAGNIYEWTMETCYTNKRVVRGGYYYNAGAINPASDRDSYSPFRSYNYFGFRLALYVK